jgi:uncharacterized protein YqeY
LLILLDRLEVRQRVVVHFPDVGPAPVTALGEHQVWSKCKNNILTKNNNNMSLEARIMEDLKEAMKNRDEATKRGIRAIKAALLLAKTDGSGEEITAEKEIKILQKLIKQRRDSLEIYEKQGREDLAVVEREEIAVIEKYLPKQLDEAELESILRQIIAESGAQGPKDMGKVMGLANKQLAGKAEGKIISQLVKRLLES